MKNHSTSPCLHFAKSNNFPTFRFQKFSKSKIHKFPKSALSYNSHFSKIHIFPKFTFFQSSHFSKVHIFPKFTFFQNSRFSRVHNFKKLNSSSQFTIQRIHASQSTKFPQKSKWLHKHKRKKK